MNCRICNSSDLHPVIDLGRQPWGNHFIRPDQAGSEPFYPLTVLYCDSCQCAQLDYTVPKEVMFSDHTYLSGSTSTLREHFRETASLIDKTFFAETNPKSVLDIGSNDGTQLQEYKKLGFDVLGVESCAHIAGIASDNKIPTIADFFNIETARELNRKFHVINASGVFFHLEELHSVTDAIKLCLRDDGVFVVQFLYMKSIMENMAFDQIYHEHLLYYTIQTITTLLEKHGLSPFDAYWAPIHGGTIVMTATHSGKRTQSKRLKDLLTAETTAKTNERATYQAFARRIEDMKRKNLEFLDKAKQDGKTIYGMGAPVKGNTLLNYFKIGTKHLKYLVEINPLRKGLVSPGMHIPVVMENELTELPDIYYVLAWNFKKEILAKNTKLIEKGVEFYFPVDPDRTKV